MIYFIPLEELEERYTKLMNSEMLKHIKPHQFIYPKWKTKPIRKGEFLDVERTIEFKAKQLWLISNLFQKNKIKNGDWFFFADIFFPGIESVKYMAELQGIDIKIASFNHAGRADRWDFVQNLGRWADRAERTYHAVSDIIFVGSNFHKQNVRRYFGIDERKIKVTGCVWNSEEAFKLYPQIDEKEDIVIWPHRPTTEKGMNELMTIAKSMPEKQFIITSSSNRNVDFRLPSNIEYINNLTKAEYYKYLSKSKYYLSTAMQETFGYTLREAMIYKCRIVVPNDLCYPEQVPNECLYKRNDINSVISKLTDSYELPETYVTKYDNNALEMLKIIENAR